MIAEIGIFALIISMIFSMLLVIIPGLGLLKNNEQWQNSVSWYVYGQFFYVSISYLCLTICFLRDDFSVQYVLKNSSILLPWFYKLCAVWGGHEGSMLLWVVILSIWMVCVSLFSRRLESRFRVRVLIILGALASGFLLFLLTTSNPFLREFRPVSSTGLDLNPLLQDLGFLFHPPMLYMGYVGFSVAFAFAIAVLWTGRIEALWAKWVRPWTLAAWCCLTIGITLGSWWAYRELGWGGWWFWDPVENASFMPWLVGTALLHSLAVIEKQQQFRAWAILLAIFAFSLSLIGTFLVRSGILTSVHAFAVDPERGLYILLFLLVVIGGSLTLFATRAPKLQNQVPLALLSRTSFLLYNNIFLVVMMLTVLLGTLYPLLIDALGLGKISVGAPYFNTVFVPLFMPLLLLMGLGIHLHWRIDNWRRLQRLLRYDLVLSFLIPLLCILLFGRGLLQEKGFSYVMYAALVLATWIIVSTLHSGYVRVCQQGFFNVRAAFYGMVIAHCGVAVTVIGIAISSEYGIQKDVRMALGSTTSLLDNSIEFVSESPVRGPNYQGTQADFAIFNNKKLTHIFPEKRVYAVGGAGMTEAATDVTLLRDIYIALGEQLDNGAWSVRMYYKPFVRWIWAGGCLILIGGILAILDRRFKPENLI